MRSILGIKHASPIACVSGVILEVLHRAVIADGMDFPALSEWGEGRGC